jgi:hypothetical protein
LRQSRQGGGRSLLGRQRSRCIRISIILTLIAWENWRYAHIILKLLPEPQTNHSKGQQLRQADADAEEGHGGDGLDAAVYAEAGERADEGCFDGHEGDHLPALVANERADEGKDQAGGDGAEGDELGVEALDNLVRACVEELGLAGPDDI